MVCRSLAIALLVTTGCSIHSLHPRSDDEPWDDAVTRNVDAARELDQEGIRSFRDARYGDAILYFRSAHRLGGPSSELWNIARSLERMDDAEGACQAISEYLAERGLAPQDRMEAEREAHALRARPSALTVTTTPTGALVSLDRKPVGPAPVTVEIPPGAHVVTIVREGYAPAEATVTARFGRAAIVSLDLSRAQK
jgi:hypothetical protein